MVKSVYTGNCISDLMYQRAKNELHWSEDRAQEMFVLGKLCETIESFSKNPDVAPIMLAKALKNSGYRYWKEVYNLAVDSSGYYSPEYKLLKDCLEG